MMSKDSVVELRVFGAYDVKERLKRQGFTWNGKYWAKRLPLQAFSQEDVLHQHSTRERVGAILRTMRLLWIKKLELEIYVAGVHWYGQRRQPLLMNPDHVASGPRGPKRMRWWRG